MVAEENAIGICHRFYYRLTVPWETVSQESTLSGYSKCLRTQPDKASTSQPYGRRRRERRWCREFVALTAECQLARP